MFVLLPPLHWLIGFQPNWTIVIALSLDQSILFYYLAAAAGLAPAPRSSRVLVVFKTTPFLLGLSRHFMVGKEGHCTFKVEDTSFTDWPATTYGLLPHLLFTLLERYIGIEPTSFRWQRNILTVILIPHSFGDPTRIRTGDFG